MPYTDPEKERASKRAWNARRTRKQRRDEKRRQRARWREQGLNAKGKPVVSPSRQEGGLRRYGHHPEGCPCHDCLWGEAN